MNFPPLVSGHDFRGCGSRFTRGLYQGMTSVGRVELTQNTTPLTWLFKVKGALLEYESSAVTS